MNRLSGLMFRGNAFNMNRISKKVTLLFLFLDPVGQDTFDFPPRSDSVELTARAVSGVYHTQINNQLIRSRVYSCSGLVIETSVFQIGHGG